MKRTTLVILVLVTFLIVNCSPQLTEDSVAATTTSQSAFTMTPVIRPSETATPTHLPSQTPTATLTMTPPIPLGSEEAEATIQALLREPVDCAAPCFFGITPGKTTLGEAWNIFTILGILHKRSVYRHPDYKGMRLTTARYDFLRMGITLIARDDIVMSLDVNMTPEEQKAGIPREWLTYSPETLIKRYGQPSKVELALDRGPNLYFEMILYFDKYDLIVSYAVNSDYPEDAGPLEVCPLTAQFDIVALWMGENLYPPLPGVSL
jgi:hypothetical protein